MHILHNSFKYDQHDLTFAEKPDGNHRKMDYSPMEYWTDSSLSDCLF